MTEKETLLFDRLDFVLSKTNINYEFESAEPLSIYVFRGDCEHDHIALDETLELYGFIQTDNQVTEEFGDNCYSSIHQYQLNEEHKIDDNIEIIKSQDHTFWLYNNELDMYCDTDISWNEYSEEEFIEIINCVGMKLYGIKWYRYDGDV